MFDIFALDPGGTNGWVYGCCVDNTSTPFQVIESGETRDMIEMGKIYEEWLVTVMDYSNKPHQTVTVIESWITHHTPFHTDANAACQPIGMARWIAYAQGAPEPVFQIPTVRTGITDAMLHAGGYWLKGGAGHKREAMRHLLMYLTNTLHGPTMRAIRTE